MSKISISRCQIAMFILAIMVIGFASSYFPVCAAGEGEELGWLEIRAIVPDDFNRSVIISVENAQTLDTYDIELLSINNYVASRQLPPGDYTVSMAFVYQNHTYNVVVAEPEFTVVFDGAAALVNVTVSNGEKTDTTVTPSPETETPAEPITTEPPVEEPSPTPSGDIEKDGLVDSVDEESPDTSSFSLKNIAIAFISSAIFAGLVFGILYFIRKSFHN